MATPSWFKKEVYLQSKLAQLRATGDNRFSDIVALDQAIEAAGFNAYTHFQAFSLIERTSPNEFFNATEYLEAKARQLNTAEGATRTDWTADTVALAIRDAGIATIYDHFVSFGWRENVNPSNNFDVSAYFDAKLAQLQKDDPAGNWDLAKVKDAFAAAGIDPIAHYLAFGKVENLAPAEVTGDERVPSDGRTDGKTFTLTTGADTGAAFRGTDADDVYTASPAVVINPADGSQSIVDTLQVVDNLNGAGGNDTLNVTFANASTSANPTLANIENINATFNAAATLNLANANGVQKVNVTGSSAAATVTNLGTVATLAVANQSQAAKFSGSTATALTVDLSNVAATADTTVDLDDALATTLTLNLKGNGTGLTGAGTNTLTIDQNAAKATTVNANVAGANFVDAVLAFDAATTFNVVGSGSLVVDGTNTKFTALETLNVTGAASVDLSALTAAALKTVAAGAATGAISVKVDGTATAVTTGAGNDKVEYTAAIADKAAVALGAGNDELTVTDTATTASVTGGDGTDTLAGTTANIATLTAAATKAAVFTGFEVLKVTDALGTGDTVNVSAIAGVTSFVAGDGVTATEAANVTGIASGSSVTLAGAVANNGTLNIAVTGASTGAADVLNLVLNKAIADDGDTTIDQNAVAINVSASDVETVNVNATGVPASSSGIDINNYTLNLADTGLVALNISGDQLVTFASAAGMTKLATIDASANTAGVSINASAAIASAPALTITGTAKADVIAGGARGDTITLGDGNDIADYSVAGSVSKIGTGAFDVIVDFKANTFGNGASGATGTEAGAQADWNGDVLRFDAGDGTAGALVDVFASAADATTFLANNTGFNNGIVAALDSTSNNLYVDNNADGVADFFIHLTGVTTIDAAAFVVI